MNYSQNAWASNCAANFARGQRGMATMLIILLIGVGTVAISLGSMYMIRSTQERQVASHAQVNAQSGAWAAVEAMRQYLLGLNAAEVAALPVNKTWTLSGYTGFTQTARFNSVTQVTVDGKTAYRVNMRISATATAAQSSSVLEVVYQTIPAVAGVTAPNTSVIHYHGDLNLTGGIDILKDAGETKPYEINVIGNVSISSTAVTGVDVIRSTASVSLSGASSFIREVYSNGDVYVSGATLPQTIQATRHICMDNANRDAYPNGESRDSVDMRANGSIILSDSGGGHNNVFALAGRGGYTYKSESARALCDTAVSGAFGSYGSGAVDAATTATAGGVKAAQWGSRANVVRSGIDIIIQGTATLGQLHAERDIHFLGNGNSLSGFARYGGTMNPGSGDTYNQLFGVGNVSGKDNKQQNYNFALEPARRVDLQTETFDVNDLKDYANYIFSVDAAGNKRVVVRQVRNSSGTALDYEGGDGKGYYLLKSWLCNTPTARVPSYENEPVSWDRPNDRLPNVNDCPMKISNLFSHGITHDGNGKWILGNQPDLAIAPGLAFFEGDLEIQSGTFYNTFLATGNITNGGATKVYAPNVAGYDGTQEGTRYAPHGICTNAAVPNLIPTQFCNGTTFNFSAIQGGIGNYALMAGTCAGANPCTKANYRGGNISTGAFSDFFGAIKAGNTFITSGNSTVHGYISALAQGVQTANHALTAKTTIDLRNLPPGFDPSGGPKNPGGSTPGTSAEVSVLWSRYL